MINIILSDAEIQISSELYTYLELLPTKNESKQTTIHVLARNNYRLCCNGQCPLKGYIIQVFMGCTFINKVVFYKQIESKI